MKIFAWRCQIFNPTLHPFAGFRSEEGRSKLLEMSTIGDRLVYVGAHDGYTAEKDRGRLLGMVEFGRAAIDLDAPDVRPQLEAMTLWQEQASTYPKALPVLRAWEFDEPRFKLIDILRQQLVVQVQSLAVALEDADARTAIALPNTEITIRLPSTAPWASLHDPFRATGPTVGPAPTAWIGTVASPPNGEAWTYALQYGTRPVWKIGWSREVAGRVREINRHVPFEVTGERWRERLSKKWSSAEAAYCMEQRLLRALHEWRTEGERIVCDESEIREAWDECVARNRV